MLRRFLCQSNSEASVFLLFTSAALLSVGAVICRGSGNLPLVAVVLCLHDVTGASLGFLVASVIVHISADPWCHPRDRRGLPVPSAAACGRVSQGECRRLPRQPCRALEPRHRHRESPQNGRTKGTGCVCKLFFLYNTLHYYYFFFYIFLIFLSSSLERSLKSSLIQTITCNQPDIIFHSYSMFKYLKMYSFPTVSEEINIFVTFLLY